MGKLLYDDTGVPKLILILREEDEYEDAVKYFELPDAKEHREKYQVKEGPRYFLCLKNFNSDVEIFCNGGSMRLFMMFLLYFL